MSFIHKIIQFIRQNSVLGSYNSRIQIGKNIKATNTDCIIIEDNVNIGDNSIFLPIKNYKGRNYNPHIKVGCGTYIGARNSFACINGIEIGKDVLFAGNVHVTDHSHGYEDINTPIRLQPLFSKGKIVIEDQCWLGFSCEILSGVHIGQHSIVAARSVVTKDVPAYSIVAGNPAKVIKQYNFNTKCWERVK